MSDPLTPEQIERHTLEPNDLAALRMLAGARDWICQEDMRLHEVLPDDVYGAGTRALSRLRSRGLLRVITGADQGSSSRYADTYQINEAGLALLATIDSERERVLGEIRGHVEQIESEVPNLSAMRHSDAYGSLDAIDSLLDFAQAVQGNFSANPQGET